MKIKIHDYREYFFRSSTPRLPKIGHLLGEIEKEKKAVILRVEPDDWKDFIKKTIDLNQVRVLPRFSEIGKTQRALVLLPPNRDFWKKEELELEQKGEERPKRKRSKKKEA